MPDFLEVTDNELTGIQQQLEPEKMYNAGMLKTVAYKKKA